MNTPAIDIKDMLEADSSLALTFATDLFVGKEPAKPNDTVTVFDVPGGAPQLTLGDQSENYYYASVQIRVRSVKYDDAWSIIYKIQELLHGKNNETWNGTLYTVIMCTGEPFVLDWDENNRIRLVINFNLQRR